MNKMQIIVPSYQQIEEMLNGYKSSKRRSGQNLAWDLLFSATDELTQDRRRINFKKLTRFRQARNLYKDVSGNYCPMCDELIVRLTELYNFIHLDKDTILEER